MTTQAEEKPQPPTDSRDQRSPLVLGSVSGGVAKAGVCDSVSGGVTDPGLSCSVGEPKGGA